MIQVLTEPHNGLFISKLATLLIARVYAICAGLFT